jgi:hypothetical protein
VPDASSDAASTDIDGRELNLTGAGEKDCSVFFLGMHNALLLEMSDILQRFIGV